MLTGRDKEAIRDAVKQQIFDFLYEDKTGLPEDEYNYEDIHMLAQNVYRHVYRAYPTEPSPIYI